MRIGLIVPSFYPAVVYGGPIFSTLYTSKELAKLNNIKVYVSTTNANMVGPLDVDTNKWIPFADRFYVKYYNEAKVNKFSFSLFLLLWRDIKKADVVHIQSIFSSPTPIALYYAKLSKKPVLLSPRGQLGGWCLENGSSFKGTWLKYCIKPFLKNITWHATSDQEKSEIQGLFHNAKVEIISNGIAFEEFQKHSFISKNEFVKKYASIDLEVDNIIVSMGRLQKIKGFDILLDSFVKILEKYPDAKLFIAGQNEGEGDNLRQKIIQLGLKEKAFLTGSIIRQEKINFLANADLFVLPSHNENFGNVYIESLATGTPIIASKNTPWSGVEVENCGKWVNNTIEETSKAILEMLQKDREQMRVNSRKHAKKYEWKNIALQFKVVYEKMLESK